jgi:hypothetical protein
MAFLDWRVLPMGAYSATIDDVRINFSATTWLGITYRVQHAEEDYSVSEILALDAPLHSADYSRTAEGKGRIKQILQIHGLAEETIKDFTDIQRALLGLSLRIEVTHKLVSGLPVPRVHSVLGKAVPSGDNKTP